MKTYHVLKGQGLSLEQEEVRQECCCNIATKEYVTEGIANTVGGIWGKETNEKVSYFRVSLLSRKNVSLRSA